MDMSASPPQVLLLNVAPPLKEFTSIPAPCCKSWSLNARDAEKPAARGYDPPAMPASSDVLITDHGAVADGRTIATAAIQRAIDAAKSAGGGRVIVPKGVFRSGSL